MENKRIIVVLASEEAESSDRFQDVLTSLGVENITRSEGSGSPVVTGTVPVDTDIPALLQTLNGMSAVRNAEEDSWSFNQ